ncbi:hypothetical protein IRZ57_13945 [Pseudomonas guariconensis]|nr:hypothetical protein [Pseudomonas guariconensis]
MATATAAATAMTTSAATVATTAATVTAATAAVATTATPMTTASAAVTTATASTMAATSTAATILGVGAGEVTDRVGHQHQRCRKHATDGQRQQTFFEQHDESPLQGCIFILESNATTNESSRPAGNQPTSGRSMVMKVQAT